MAASSLAKAVAGPQALELLAAAAPDQEALAALNAMDLRNLGLTSVPSALGLCRGLARLDLGGNPLQELPQTLPDLERLEVLFISNLGLTALPPHLAECTQLRMLGIKDNKLASINGQHLPADLVWLVAAGNPARELPNIGRLQHVRKLMLSHNKLTCRALEPVAGIAGLEMIRVAANQLEAFPKPLLQHPRLAWVAVGSNPFSDKALEKHLAEAPAVIDFEDVTVGERLGSGAGATVYKGCWQGREVAVKIWEGEHFSDGTARGEWAVNRVAGAPGHAALVGMLGAFEQPRPGMVLELLAGAKAAAGGPTFSTVTRDCLPAAGGQGPRFTPAAARRVAESVAQATAYLHARGLLHGDIYLHNTLVVAAEAAGPAENSTAEVDVCDARLSDFGAASAAPPGEDGAAMQLIEARSYGWLLQDLLDILEEEGEGGAVSGGKSRSASDKATIELLRSLRQWCAHLEVERLPSFGELVAALSTVTDGANDPSLRGVKRMGGEESRM